jgi:hypothetical protein
MPSPAASIRCRPAWVHPIRAAALAGAALLALGVPPARAVDPLAVLRSFCQADGNGARMRAATWPAVAPLVAWSLEPAWDHLYLIHGYEIGTPAVQDDRIVVEVKYTLARTVRSSGARPDARVESRRLALEPDESGGWRLSGPPPPPHVFASQADPDTLVALLAPEGSPYQSNSAFVWHLLRDAGFELPYADTAALPTAFGLRAERSANVGDLVLYYADGIPYHVAMVDADDTVVSATLNGGLRRTPFGAFAGEIRYLRPVSEADLPPTPAPAATPARERR